jgi:hypothetical protein
MLFSNINLKAHEKNNTIKILSGIDLIIRNNISENDLTFFNKKIFANIKQHIAKNINFAFEKN